MIILGNPRFATAMQLAGISNSHRVVTREQGLQILKGISKEEPIIANTSVVEKIPELKEFKNVVTVPDSAKEFGSIEDLKDTVKSAVGIDIEV